MDADLFHGDMFLDFPLVADLLSLQQIQQGLIDRRLLAANAKRIAKDWQVNKHVYIRNQAGTGDKLKPAYRGPYPII